MCIQAVSVCILLVLFVHPSYSDTDEKMDYAFELETHLFYINDSSCSAYFNISIDCKYIYIYDYMHYTYDEMVTTL